MKNFYFILLTVVWLCHTGFSASAQKYGFLSLKDTPAEMNADENAAWTWFTNRYAYEGTPHSFVPFSAIASGTVDLSTFSVLWWHNDAELNLPALVTSGTVLTAMQAYLSSGKSLFLSTYAVQYIAALNVAKDGLGPNVNAPGAVHTEVYGEGFSINGYEAHPIFAPLVADGRVWDFGDGIKRLYTLYDGTSRSSKESVWVFPGPYANVSAWKTATGGLDLGGAEWEGNRGLVVTMAEFPKNNVGTNGTVVCIGSRAYDWAVDPGVPNSAYFIQSLEILTFETIKYLNGFVTLPIKLNAFTATAQNNSVLVKWQTASETNNLKFVVERSTDKANFIPITEINGALNSTTTKAYYYHDYSAPTGTSYYRLKQIDVDGKYSYSDVVAANLKSSIESAEVVVYPNPTKQSIKLKNLKQGQNSYAIHSLAGQKLLSGHIVNNEINIANKLSTGIYLLSVTANNKAVQVLKVIVE